MGKFDHINELLGVDSYPSWRRAVRLALAGEGLWNHCSSGTDPIDIAKYASAMPAPATAGQPTVDELKLMKEWIKEDTQAKAIISRKLSPVVQNMLDEQLTACGQWDMLLKRFAHLNVTLQFELHSQLFMEKLKDAEDAGRYLGVFENGRQWFMEMQITFTDEEAIFMLLNGLPDTPQWVFFRSLTIGLYNSMTATTMSSSAVTSSTSAATSNVSFEQVTISFTKEANHQHSHLKMARPGSEYTNIANASLRSDRKNPTTGIHMHKHNPKGVPCDNPVCVGLPHSLMHDQEHCLQPGGGMEGKAPWGQKVGKPRKDIAASTSENKAGNDAAANSTPSTAQSAASAVTTESNHHQNLSFVVIEEIEQDYSHLALRETSSILDSATTSTLIMDHDVFWLYKQGSSVKVKTANHGFLSTSRCSDCIADLTINGHTWRISLIDCLHVPSTYINLLSVSHMLKTGWACNFQPYPPWCKLSHQGTFHGKIPEVGDLFSVDLKFVHCREHSYAGLVSIYFPMYHTPIRLSSAPSESHPTLIRPIQCTSAFRMTCGYLRISSYSSRICRIHPVHIRSTSLVRSYAHFPVTD
ncbi:hypothetical protein DFH29DRAFT_805640 [Suillus ampliporus]|nr:hypothetical protein DFH29DRAFT_805640 [Suillus ampliporus]